jgi:hypothetical protein
MMQQDNEVVGHDVDDLYSTLASTIVKRPVNVTRTLAKSWMRLTLATKPGSVETASLTEHSDLPDRLDIAPVVESDAVSDISEEDCHWQEVVSHEETGTTETQYWESVLEAQSHEGDVRRSSHLAELHLGTSYLQAKDYQAAFDVFSISAAIAAENSSTDSLWYATCMHQLSVAAAEIPDLLARAIDASTAACTIRYNQLGAMHLDTVESYNVLGHLYWKNDEAELAMATLSKVFKLQRAIWGPADPQVALAARELAHYSILRRDLVQARRFFSHALRSCRLLRLDHLVKELEKEMLMHKLHEVQITVV